MKEDKDIKKLFREGLEEAPMGFGNKIMDRLEAEEKANATIMQVAGSETPSPDFTALVMKKVEAEHQVAEPLLPWSMAIAGVAACLVFVLLTLYLPGEYPQNTAPWYGYLHEIISATQSWFGTLLAVALVALVDQLYKLVKLTT